MGLLLVLLILTLFPSLALLSFTESKLTLHYYNHTCPNFDKIMQQVVIDKQLANPTTAAGTLRVFFHDCVVGGCDSSLLISSTAFNTAERDNDINLSLPGDAFDLIVRAKTALELECPGIVSCTDILAVATRNLITMVGGPYYKVVLGRKDSLVSKASDVEGHIARPNMSVTQIINMFDSKGLNVREMVALTGAHTIGFSHCSEFSYRIFNFSKSSSYDPTMNPKFVQELRKLCGDYKKNEALAAFNDVMTPGKFDNMYFLNLQKGLGLLASDQAMAFDPSTKPFVDRFAANQTEFFEAFAAAIDKVSKFGVKTGRDGEVRRRCDAFNNGIANSNQKTSR